MRWSEFPRGSALALLALLLLPITARAQTLFVQGAVDHPAADLLRDIVQRQDYRILDRDTVLPAATDLPQDLVVIDARVVLEGTVRGAVAVVAGELFLRPGSRVMGSVADIEGTVVVARTASTGGRTALPAEVRAEITAAADAYRVALHTPPRPPFLTFPRLAGAVVPTFDRVNGFTVGWGLALNLGRDTTGARAWATALYHTERGDPGADLGVEAPLGRDLWLAGTASSQSVTNEEWIRGDLVNSASALIFRSDARDYYHSDRVAVTLRRRLRQPLQAGQGFVGPRVGLLASRDRSLRAGDPWTLPVGDGEWRPNPLIAEGTLLSGLAGADLGWRGATLRFTGDVGIEWAPGTLSDFEFVQLVAEGTWTMAALWGHALQVYARTHAPFGDSGAPRQRWSHLGGTGTLPTLERGVLRGDHLVFVDSRYLVPLNRLVVPVIGSPSLRLQHAVGSAWPSGSAEPRWEQNLGIGLEFRLLEAMVFLNPADELTGLKLQLGAALSRF